MISDRHIKLSETEFRVNSTIEFYSDHASIYDVYQQECVPRYHEMIGTSVRWLGRLLPRDRAVTILDLGCGTGNTSQSLAQTFPEARIWCLDGAIAMLQVARSKLPPGKVEFLCRDIAESGWSRLWPSDHLDGAVSVLVLEHLPFEPYRAVLSELLGVLKPGAWFAAVEGYAGDLVQNIYYEEMADLERRVVQDRTLTAEHLRLIKAESHEKEIHYFASIDRKKQWWADAGYVDVDVIWQYYCVAVMVGRKPG